MYKELETERLRISAMVMDDYPFLFRLMNTEGWLKFIGDRGIRSLQDAKNYVQKIMDNPNYYCSVFASKETGEKIGIITFIYRDDQKYPDLGFAMLPRFARKGYAYEAARKYLDALTKEKVSEKIFGITVQGNTNSIHLIEKLGMQKESEYEENEKRVFVYSLNI